MSRFIAFPEEVVKEVQDLLSADSNVSLYKKMCSGLVVQEAPPQKDSPVPNPQDLANTTKDVTPSAN